MTPRLILFDLDGTLIESRNDLAESVNILLERYGAGRFPYEEILHHVGRGMRNLVDGALEQAGLTAIPLDEAIEAFEHIYAEHLMDTTRCYEGVLETLAALAHIPKAVLSNKPQVFVERIVEGLGLTQHFVGLFGAEAVPILKPSPGGMQFVLSRLGVAPQDAVMVGDSEYDILAARDAGTVAVGVLYGFHERERLEAVLPDYLIHDIRELIMLVKNGL